MGKADLHIHTDFSDGSASLKDVLESALEKGLDSLAITDHNVVEGAVEAQALARRRGLPLQVVVGEEITSSEGHIIGLFLGERIRPLLSARATIEEIHRQGGLAVAPHPFSLWLRLFRCGGVGEKIEYLQFDAVETVNGSLMEGPSNWYAGRFNRLRTRLAELGGSDAHTAEAVGQAYTLYPGRGPGMLRQAIYHKATRARESNGRLRALACFLRDHVQGKTALFGEKGGYVSGASQI
jgi:hypothetical protein